METKKRNFRLRMVPFTIGLFSILACFCGSGDEGASTSAYTTFHAMDTPDNLAFDLTLSGKQYPLAADLAFGVKNGPTYASMGGAVSVSARKAGTQPVIGTTNFTGALYNVIMQFGTPVSPKAAVSHPSRVQRPMIVVAHGDWSLGPVDVYVTAPAANLANLAPDATSVAYGNLAAAPDWIHEGANFQVRLCAVGTKNVVRDFGTKTNALAYEVYYMVPSTRNGAPIATQFSISTK